MLSLHVVYMLLVIASNLSGFETTKNASSSTRTTFAALYPVIILIFSFIVKWERFDELETPVKIVGFVVAIAGVLIYNDVLVVFKKIRKTT